jgi:hypothetical protein
MEFLDIILTKVSSVFCSILLSDFTDKLYLKSKIENPRNKKTQEYSRQKIKSEKTRVYAKKPHLKMPYKNSISAYVACEKSDKKGVALLTVETEVNGDSKRTNERVLPWLVFWVCRTGTRDFFLP